jgi:hypothetical protein
VTNLKQKINTKGRGITGCYLLPGGRMVIFCSSTNTVSFINTGGVELFHISKEKTGLCTYNTVYIKDNNSVAVSSGDGNIKCIAIIDIESQKVMTTISMDTNIYGMAVRCRTIYYCTKDKGIKMLNLSDKSVSDIINSNTTTLLEEIPTTYTFPSLSTEIPTGPCRTRVSLNSHCVVPCKSQHVTVFV